MRVAAVQERVAPPHVLARLVLQIRDFLTIQQGRVTPVTKRLSAAGGSYCVPLNRAEFRDFIVPLDFISRYAGLQYDGYRTPSSQKARDERFASS